MRKKQSVIVAKTKRSVINAREVQLQSLLTQLTKIENNINLILNENEFKRTNDARCFKS